MQLLFDASPEFAELLPLGMGVLQASRVIVGPAPSLYADAADPYAPMGHKALALLDQLKGTHSLYITTVSKVRQEAKKSVGAKAMRVWGPKLYTELAAVVQPHVTRVLAMGKETATLLCPGFRSLREDHGTVFWNPELQCEVLASNTFAMSMHDPEKRKLLSSDLQRFFDGVFQDAQAYSLNAPTEELTPEVVLDIETTGLNPLTDSILSVGIQPTRKSPVYILQKPNRASLVKLYDMLKSHVLIGHNIAFDLSFLEMASGKPWTSLQVKDTMLAAYVLGEEVLSLKHLVTTYTDLRGSHSGGSFEDPQYLAEDVAGTQAVGKIFLKRAKGQWIASLLYELSPKIAKMRLYGVHIDWSIADQLERDFETQVHNAKKRLDAHVRKAKMDPAELNWNSNQQVADFLLKAKVPLTQRTNTGLYSTSEAALLPFRGDKRYPVIADFFEHKDRQHELEFILSYKKLRGSDLRLHPKFNLTGAATGRSSMSDPNLQQVPRVGPIKNIFTSRFNDGYFGLIDLAQAELRVAALLSGDEALVDALLQEDVHRVIAASIYELPPEEVSATQRKRSKGVTFGLLYGGGAAGLAQRVGVPEDEVKKIIKVFYGRFPQLADYMALQKSLAVTTGQSTTPLGRIRKLDTLIELEGDSSAERKGINGPIQGTASDIMMVILNYVFHEVERHRLQSGVIFGVHDSCMHDVHPEERETYVKIVQQAFVHLNTTPLAQLPLWKRLPITGEFVLGRSWASVESTNEAGYNPIFKYGCSSL